MIVTENYFYAQSGEKLFEIAKFYGNKKAAISYTFDDGLEEHFTLIYPKFEELGFKGTFWINGNTINEGEIGQQKEKPRISWNELKTMANSGHEISNHGWSHKNLSKIPLDEVWHEITANDSIIQAKIGEKPETFCYAFNSKNDTIIKMASLGRVGTRTRQISMGHKSTSEKLKSMIEKIIENGEWKVAMIHGITYGYDAFTDANIFWNHLEMIKNMEDKIWVAAFRDVAAYIQEQKNTQLNIITNKQEWIITPKNNLDKNLFTHSLTMIVNRENIKKIKVKQDGKNIPVYFVKNKALFDFNPYNKIIVRII